MSKKIIITEKQAAEQYNFTHDLWRFLFGLENGERVHIAPINAYFKKSRKGKCYFYASDGTRSRVRPESLTNIGFLMNSIRSFYAGQYTPSGKYEIPAEAKEIQVPRGASLMMVTSTDTHYLQMLRTTLGSLVSGGKVIVTAYGPHGKAKEPMTIERTDDGFVLTHKDYSFKARRRWAIVNNAVELAKSLPVAV